MFYMYLISNIFATALEQLKHLDKTSEISLLQSCISYGKIIVVVTEWVNCFHDCVIYTNLTSAGLQQFVCYRSLMTNYIRPDHACVKLAS